MTKLQIPEVIMLLGQRYKEYRIHADMTQAEVAHLSGVSEATIKRFESGIATNITMGSFIALLKAIDYMDGLEEVLPALPMSPYLMAKLEEQKPKRVRHAK